MTYNFPTEYQDWILLGFTFGFIYALLFPMWLAGLPYQTARNWAQFLNRRLYLYLTCVISCSTVLFLILIALCPNWTIDQYFHYWGVAIAEIGRHISVFASSGVVLLVFFFAFILRDRIKILLGIENIYLFKCSMRECLSCFLLSAPSKPVEVYIYKVEELPAASMMSANDVFVQLSLGSNEKVRTRVRKGAGSNAVIKELLQLNYDPDEEEDKLVISVKHQDMLLASDIASIELTNKDINQIIQIHDVQQLRLFPQGKIWLSIGYVDDEDGEGEARGTLLNFF